MNTPFFIMPSTGFESLSTYDGMRDYLDELMRLLTHGIESTLVFLR